MNVLSLFDGMSCGRIALERAGIQVDNYFASEVDKYAIKVSKANYPNIIHIGDVTKVKYEQGVLYFEGGSERIHVDLIIGGSPCQDFSYARAMGNNGSTPSGLNGAKSGLFYEYLRILKELQQENPEIKFLLENVKMKKSSKKSLDDYMQIEGILFDSSLVSFQRRSRYYWTNIKFCLPSDKGISFQSSKEVGDLSFYKLNKTPSRERMWNGGKSHTSETKHCANVTNADKVYCLTTKQDRCPNSGLVEYEDFCRYLTRGELEAAQTVPYGYTDCLSYNQAQTVLGNGWTVDVIAHIFKGLKEEDKV